MPIGTRLALGLLLSLASSGALAAQGRFPPDSLTNLQVIPKGTPVQQVIGMMRGFTSALGVRCQYCHLGEEGQPLSTFNFASDEKRTKKTARIMRAARKRNGLTQSEIAKRLQTSQANISKLENAMLIPSAPEWFEF